MTAASSSQRSCPDRRNGLGQVLRFGHFATGEVVRTAGTLWQQGYRLIALINAARQTDGFRWNAQSTFRRLGEETYALKVGPAALVDRIGRIDGAIAAARSHQRSGASLQNERSSLIKRLAENALANPCPALAPAIERATKAAEILRSHEQHIAVQRAALWPTSNLDRRRIASMVLLIPAITLVGILATGAWIDARHASQEQDASGAISQIVDERGPPVDATPYTYASESSDRYDFQTPAHEPAKEYPSPNDQALSDFLLQAAAQHQLQQQAEKNQQYESFKRSAEQARTCQACAGAGSYRFVDSTGQLRMQSCPYCHGLGRNW